MTKQFTSDRPTVDEILRLKKPNRKFVPIILDSEIHTAITLKEQEIVRTRRAKGKGSLADKSEEALIDELNAIIEEAEAVSVVFAFQDIGKKRYDELERAYPPTPEQKIQWKEDGEQGRLAYNVDLFVPALLAATSIELSPEEEEAWREEGGLGRLAPAISQSQAEQIFAEWSDGDIELLFIGAMTACKERTSIPLSKRGIVAMPSSDLNSTTALNGESPTVSS